jgi:hypothetical protein
MKSAPVYVITVLCNLLISLVLRSAFQLLYILFPLSFPCIYLTISTVPKMVLNMSIQSKNKFICFPCCLTQMYLFHFFGVLNNILIGIWNHGCLSLYTVGPSCHKGSEPNSLQIFFCLFSVFYIL